jgi:hypothetical protein
MIGQLVQCVEVVLYLQYNYSNERKNEVLGITRRINAPSTRQGRRDTQGKTQGNKETGKTKKKVNR